MLRFYRVSDLSILKPLRIKSQFYYLIENECSMPRVLKEKGFTYSAEILLLSVNDMQNGE